MFYGPNLAFYGPKLEFMIKDRNGKEWQCGTIQVDFILPERLDVKFTDSDGLIKHPVILHRAILGSFERFIGILLENEGYNLASWYHPRLMAIIDISDEGFDNYIVEDSYFGDQVVIDRSKENLRSLIKKYSEQKFKYIMVHGNKEYASGVYPVNVLGGERVNVLKENIMEFLSK